MWSFQYKHGDRPLEGYTIERAAGRGGFGEVYYAVSDSGREVALKAVQGYEQIELRGISQCMNLKSPHLVSIFDVRHNDQGRPFVIMEFVNGPSLRQLLDEAPSGLGEQKAAFFLREIAKGLTFLHDCGIVHRDLKPGNIFYENGYVKIGDYGLSKAITIGQTSQQTVTVGTVHYMAPEIGAGRYDRSIDIYAMGAVLFEMLTGTVPHVGASPSEILMKHLSVEPDCSGISEPFATVIKKAMHKDPTRRYQSVQEMVEAVFGAEHVRNSMSVFAAEDLSMVAGRVAQRVSPQPATSSSVVGKAPVRAASMWDRMGQNFDRAGGRVGRVGRDLFGAQEPRVLDYESFDPAQDPMRKRDRRLLAIFVSLVIAVAAGQLGGPRGSGFWMPAALTALLGCCGASMALDNTRNWMLTRMRDDSQASRRFTASAIAFGAALVLSSVAWLAMDGSYVSRTWITVGIGFFLVDIATWFMPWRVERVSLKAAGKAGLLTWIGTWFVQGGSATLAIAIVAGTALMVQLLSAWDPRGAEQRRRFEAARKARQQQEQHEGEEQPQHAHPVPVTPMTVDVGGRRAQAFAVTLPGDCNTASGSSPTAMAAWRPAPKWMRIAWIVAFAAFFTVGLMLLIGVSFNAFGGGDEAAIAQGFGVGLIVASGLALLRSFVSRYFSVWQYLIRPALLMLCFESIVVSSIITSRMPNVLPDERMIGMFFIIFPCILFVTIILISWQLGSARAEQLTVPAPLTPSQAGNSPHNRTIAAILTSLAFFGLAGLQRIYVGKIGTGILWLLTWGLCGVGQIIDLVMILGGSFKDAQGRAVTKWDSDPRTETASAAPASPAPSPASFAGIAIGNVRVGVSHGHGRKVDDSINRAADRVRWAAERAPRRPEISPPP